MTPNPCVNSQSPVNINTCVITKEEVASSRTSADLVVLSGGWNSAGTVSHGINSCSLPWSFLAAG